MTIDEEKQQLRATIRRLSAQLPFRYREAADRAIAQYADTIWHVPYKK